MKAASDNPGAGPASAPEVRPGNGEAPALAADMFAAILNTSPQSVFWKDRNGVYLGCNAAFARTAGLSSPDEVVGKTDFDLPWSRAEAEAYRADDRDVVENNRPKRHIVEPLRNADGTLLWIDTTKIPLPGADGRAGGVLGVFDDITERRRTEAELRESEAKHRAVVEAFDGLIYVCSQDYRVEFMNPRFIERTGRDATGEPCHKALHNLEAPCPWCVNDRVFRGETVRWEIKSPKDGRWYDVVNTPLRHADGTLSKLAMIQDITERKEAEELLRRHKEDLEQVVTERTRELTASRRATISLLQDAAAQRDRAEQALAALTKKEAALQTAVRKAEAANQELEAFSYSVSHDLRAPLRRISAFVELLQAELAPGENAKVAGYGNAIATSAQKMTALINDLLAFSRAGRAEMRRGRVPLADLVAECRRDLQEEIGGRTVEWEVGDLPVVQGDPALLHQVLANLLNNAVKYTRNRPVARITVSAARKEGEFILCVRDNGAGFDMRNAGRLFGVFQRLHADKEFEGTGIGLANVRRIILRHGGRTWAEGAVGQGAAFYFSLPAEEGGPA